MYGVGSAISWNDGCGARSGVISDLCGLGIYPETPNYGLGGCWINVDAGGTSYSVQGDWITHISPMGIGGSGYIPDPVVNVHTDPTLVENQKRMTDAITRMAEEIYKQNNPEPPPAKQPVQIEDVSDNELLLI